MLSPRAYRARGLPQMTDAAVLPKGGQLRRGALGRCARDGSGLGHLFPER